MWKNTNAYPEPLQLFVSGSLPHEGGDLVIHDPLRAGVKCGVGRNYIHFILASPVT